MRQFKQILIYDDGTPDLTVYMSVARNPLKTAKIPPRVVLSWSNGNTEFWCAYWVKRGKSGMTDVEIMRFCEGEFLLLRRD